MELVDLNGLAPMAGVTAAMGEELNGQTHSNGPTAGVTLIKIGRRMKL